MTIVKIILGILLFCTANLATLIAAHAVMIDVGTLPDDGTSVSFTGDLISGGLDIYDFSMLGDVNNGDSSFLNIQTFGQGGFTLMDTEIGLYDALGILITSDDDDNGDDPFTILYSLLTFGDGDPLGTTVDSIAGEDGTLVAGAYTLVVGGFSTDFTQDINDITGGTSAGDYNIQFTHRAPVPAPAPANIPTLPSNALILLALLVTTFAVRHLRQI